MNLYKIIFTHYAPKDSKSGIVCLMLADNDEQVYEFIASEPKIAERRLYNGWRDNEKVYHSEEHDAFYDEYDAEVSGWNDDEGSPELFKARMVRLRGEANDEDADCSDAYYGVTHYGWELLKENCETDYSELIQLGILYTHNP